MGCGCILFAGEGKTPAFGTDAPQQKQEVDVRLPDASGTWQSDTESAPKATAFDTDALQDTTVLRPLRAADRILIVAPHPDDESLSSGGLMQRALVAGARIRVVFITNGDNNVWAQRFVEHRYHIGDADRARWGARRQQEALHALARIGVPAKCAVFLGFHDQGTSALLMANDSNFRDSIDSAIIEWHPTILVLPAPGDLHPDHNNAYVITHLELARLHESVPLELDYLVHTNGKPYVHSRIVLQLRPEEKQVKLEAILCHTSQMALGRGRFGAFAKDLETFYPPDQPAALSATYPVCSARIVNDSLRMTICKRNTRSLHGAKIDLAGTGGKGGCRISFLLPEASGSAAVTDTASGQSSIQAAVTVKDGDVEIALPLDGFLPVRQLYVKFDRPGIAFDRAGWREIPTR